MAEIENSHGRSKGMSIRWKLFAYLAIFTAFVLLVIWIFQVLLLNRFYETIKIDELNSAAATVSESVADQDTLEEDIKSVYKSSLIFTKVYRMESDGTPELITSLDAVGDYYLKYATISQLAKIYKKATLNNGTYYERRTVTPFGEGIIPMPPSSDDTDNAVTDAPETKMKEIVYAKIVDSDSGERYVILMNAIYTPLDATVNTLKIQFMWIAVILLFGAFLLTALMSARISSPIIKMNAAAKRLAKGNYEADFEGGGFRETRELADSLNYASEELSKADRLQKELVANISHDLRTPLTMITGYSEVMRDIPGENTPENVQVIIDESVRLTELVNDMLDLSKIRAGTVNYEMTEFNLTETVRSTMNRYRKLTDKDGYRIEYSSDSEVFVYGDRARLLQVIYNLINNALNYAGEDKLVRVEQTILDGRVRISVSDDGEGIPAEKLANIWDRYYKVDRVHKRAIVGTGLGLSIVKEILEAHGASYGVESSADSGSTFWFELPTAPEPDQTNNTI